MNENDTKRLPRLTAILTQLQTKRLTTAAELSAKFGVSIRTIYRDIKALEQAGVPVFTAEGKGYSLVEGYRLPPVMLSESEANALITAEQLVIKNKDASFIKEYSKAILKIKAVLHGHTKEKANLLSSRIAFSANRENERTSNYLSVLQLALTGFTLVQLSYLAADTTTPTQRTVEPFALVSTQENWLLIAWCRLRSDYRAFRLDRICGLHTLNEKFEPHKMTLEEYFILCRQNTAAS